MRIAKAIPYLFILRDDSGSMSTWREKTKEMINALIERWRGKDALISLASYGDESGSGGWQYDYKLLPAKHAELLEDISPYYSHESPAKVLRKAIAEIKGHCNELPIGQVMLAVYTDGDDDSALDYEFKAGAKLIAEVQDLGWKVVIIFPFHEEDAVILSKTIMGLGFTREDIMTL